MMLFILLTLPLPAPLLMERMNLPMFVHLFVHLVSVHLPHLPGLELPLSGTSNVEGGL